MIVNYPGNIKNQKAYHKFVRNIAIYKHRINGLTYKSIGERAGLTGSRVRQICVLMERRGRIHPEWFKLQFGIDPVNKD